MAVATGQEAALRDGRFDPTALENAAPGRGALNGGATLMKLLQGDNRVDPVGEASMALLLREPRVTLCIGAVCLASLDGHTDFATSTSGSCR